MSGYSSSGQHSRALPFEALPSSSFSTESIYSPSSPSRSTAAPAGTGDSVQAQPTVVRRYHECIDLGSGEISDPELRKLAVEDARAYVEKLKTLRDSGKYVFRSSTSFEHKSARAYYVANCRLRGETYDAISRAANPIIKDRLQRCSEPLEGNSYAKLALRPEVRSRITSLALYGNIDDNDAPSSAEFYDYACVAAPYRTASDVAETAAIDHYYNRVQLAMEKLKSAVALIESYVSKGEEVPGNQKNLSEYDVRFLNGLLKPPGVKEFALRDEWLKSSLRQWRDSRYDKSETEKLIANQDDNYVVNHFLSVLFQNDWPVKVD